MVRVKCSILPPTIIIAPTSDNPLPSPTNEFVNKGYLASQISVLIIDKLDNLNVETLDIKSLEKEIKDLEKNIKEKYKEYYTEENVEKYLDSEE